MKIRNAIIGWLIRKLSNRYEAATWSPSRPFVPGYLQDARYDADAMSRTEIARKVRYYGRNTWIVPRLREEDQKYTVGPHGLCVRAASSDSEWNKRIDESFLRWCESPFRDSALPMAQGQRVLASEVHDDGEVFMNLTRLKWKGRQSRPAIECIESHRVCSPDFSSDFVPRDTTKPVIIDGVQLGVDENGRAIGRPAGYHVIDGIDGDKNVFVPAYDPAVPFAGGMVHIYDPHRIGMFRAISGYAPILNELADIELLASLEMDRAKSNSLDSKIFKTQNGEIPPAMRGGVPFLPGPTSPNIPSSIDKDKDLQNRVNQFRKAMGGRVTSINLDEDVIFPSNPSPTAAQQWFWLLTTEKICIAKNIPRMLVLPESVQGTVGRAVLDDAHLSFQAKFRMEAEAAKKVWRFYVDWARYNIADLADAPADWKLCEVTGPRACNVDKGKNTNANLALLAVGARSYDDDAADDGTTADERFYKKGYNIGRVKQIAAEVSADLGVEVKPEEIMEPLAKVLQSLAQAEQASAAAELATRTEEVFA